MLSLKTKLALLATCPILISFCAFHYLNTYQFTRPLETALAEDLEAKARLVGNDIDRFVTQRVTDARLLSHAERLLSPNLLSINHYLGTLASDSEWISEIDLLDRTGRIIAHSGEETGLNRFIWDNYPPIQELFAAARKAKQKNVYVMETTELDTNEGAGILLLTPVVSHSPNQANRYLLIELSLVKLKQIVTEFGQLLAGGKHIYVVRNDGSIVISDQKDLQSPQLFPDLDRHPDILSFLATPGAEGHFNYVDRMGDQLTASYIDLAEFGENRALDWSILATAKTGIIMAPVKETANILIAIGIIFCALTAGAALLLFRKIAVPLDQIADAATKIEQGDYQHRLSIHGGKELMALAETFNRMASKIMRHTEELQSSNLQLKTFRTIIEASPTPIYLCDSEGRYLMLNRAFQELHNLHPEEAIGKSSTELLSQHCTANYLAQVKEVFASGRRVEQLTRVPDHTGKLHDVLITKFPVHDSSGDVFAVGGIDIDLSDQKRLEEQLQHAQKMEAIGTLAGGIAHDFNNLLAAILGHLHLVEQKLTGGQGIEKNVSQIKQAATRAVELVRQILTYSRQEKVTLAPVQVQRCIEESLELLIATFPSSIDIQTSYAEDADELLIDADKTQLQQILINLCTNAAHAMDGKGVLEIGLKKVDYTTVPPPEADWPAGSYAQLSVKDNGSGMSAETISKIFDPFFTTKPAGDGTGMGLSVVHGLVKKHNGFITVNSRLNKGSTFTLWVPISAGDRPVIAESRKDELPSGHENILFVDDEEGLASACVEMLELQGYQVTSTSSSTAALRLFTATPEHFDLVITDQTMPEMLGTELASELRRIKPILPIILCSGHHSEQLARESAERGIHVLQMKPVDMRALAQTVRQALDAPIANKTGATTRHSP